MTQRFRRLFIMIAVACAMTCGAARAVELSEPAPGKSGVVMVPMRDGIKLATQIEIPAGAKGPMPVVLLRSPYSRNLFGALGLIQGFVGKGFVFVSQDTRGRYDSEGENLPFLADQDDGYDTVEWIAKQPWSDGRVAMMGGSALGITGYQAAIASPDHLKCVLAVVAPANIQSQAIIWGGELRKDLAIGWTVGTVYPVETLTQMTDHTFYDDYAKKYDLSYNASKVRTPMLHVGGWFDIFTQGTIAAYNSLQANGGPGAKGYQRLIMGPWTHAGMIASQQGELEFPSNSMIMPMVNEILGWTNRCMDGKLKEIENPVTYYMMGDVSATDTRWNTWRKTTTWPPPGIKNAAWNLTPSHGLSTAPAEVGEFTYAFDPSNPVKTRGGGNLTIGTHGSVDQREVENRPDVVLFDTPVFEEPYAIAGPIYAELEVSTSACDTDFTAKITDVYPDGRSMLIGDGIARAQFREYEKDRLVPAVKGEKMRLKVYVGDTAYTFNKGHKIRLAVSSSNHPRFSVNTNTCEDNAFPHHVLGAEYNAALKKDKSPTHEGVKYEIAQNTVHTGPSASSLILPEIEVK